MSQPGTTGPEDDYTQHYAAENGSTSANGTKYLERKKARLTGKANEQMTPDELEDYSKLISDEEIQKERTPGCCQKLTYFFFHQKYKSHLETYLELKAENGESADYSVLENESILKNYGIILPEQSLNQ